MRDYFLFQVVRPSWPQRVVVLLGLVAEDLCAKPSDAIRRVIIFRTRCPTMGDPAGEGIATDVATTRPMRSTRASEPATLPGDAAA